MTRPRFPIPADGRAGARRGDLDRAVLVLEDGTRYEGRAYGARAAPSVRRSSPPA